MKNVHAIASLLVIFSPGLSFAKTSYEGMTVPKKGGNLTEALNITPRTLNPFLSTDLESQDLAGLFYMGLMGTDGETYETYPALATKVEISKDKKDYTYTLNTKATFTDGSAVTSDDAEFSFQKLMDPKVEAAALRTYFEGVTFQKIDQSKFKFHVNEPKFNTLDFLNSFAILSKKQFSGEADFNQSKEHLRPIGTGPFVLKTFSRDQAVVLERVPNWWAKDLPEFRARYNQNTWTFKIIPDMALRYEKFLKGELDTVILASDQFANQVNGIDKDKFGKSPNDGKTLWAGKLPADGPMGWTGIALNLKNPLLTGIDTRKGLAYLVDYKAMKEKVFFGLIDQSVSPFGSNTMNTDPDLKKGKGIYTFDAKKASTLFEKDGWKREEGQPFLMKTIDGKKLPLHLVLKFPASNPAFSKVVVIMKETYKKSGVDLELRPMDSTALYKDFEDRNFEAMVIGWGAGGMEPDAKQLWASESQGGGSNKVGFSNAKVDELIKKANVEFDKKKRSKYLQEINKILYDEVPYIFLAERHFLLRGINSRLKSPKWVERFGSDLSKDLFYE